MNEEEFIVDTLQRLDEAVQALQRDQTCPVQVIVVDNASDDRTAEVARSLGASVIPEPVRNIARARNTGARMAKGDVLLFLDADTLVPSSVLLRIVQTMSHPNCLGGAVDVLHRPSSALVNLYLRCWRVLGRSCGMAQGAAQFWRRETFLSQGGYDETIYMGEDVEFYSRTKRAARKQGCHVSYLDDIQVIPSPRRFDRWPLWKTLLWTNPLLISVLSRWKRPWRGWYEDAPR